MAFMEHFRCFFVYINEKYNRVGDAMKRTKYIWLFLAVLICTFAVGCNGGTVIEDKIDDSGDVSLTDENTSDITLPLADGEIGFHSYTVPVMTYGNYDSNVGSAQIGLVYNSAIYTEDDRYLENMTVVRCDVPDVTENEIFNWCYSGFAKVYDLTITEELKPDEYKNYEGVRYFHGFEDQVLVDVYGEDKDAEYRARREYMYLLKLQDSTYLMLSWRVPDDMTEIPNEGEHFDNAAARASVSINWNRKNYSEYLLERVVAILRSSEFYVDTASGQCTFPNENGMAGESFADAMQADKWMMQKDQSIRTKDAERFYMSVQNYRIYAADMDGYMIIETPRSDFSVCYCVPEGTVDALVSLADGMVSNNAARREAHVSKMCDFLPDNATGLEYFQRIWSSDDYLLCYRMTDGGLSVWRAESLGTSYNELSLPSPDGISYDKAEVMLITSGGGSGEYIIYIAYYSGEPVRDNGYFMTGEDTRYFMFLGTLRDDSLHIAEEMSEDVFLDVYHYYNPPFDTDHGKYYASLNDNEIEADAEYMQ